MKGDGAYGVAAVQAVSGAGEIRWACLECSATRMRITNSPSDAPPCYLGAPQHSTSSSTPPLHSPQATTVPALAPCALRCAMGSTFSTSHRILAPQLQHRLIRLQGSAEMLEPKAMVH